MDGWVNGWIYWGERRAHIDVRMLKRRMTIDSGYIGRRRRRRLTVDG